MNEVRHWNLLVGGEWVDTAERIEVRNAFDGALAGTVARATPADVEHAVDAAARAVAKPFPAHERFAVLMRAADRIEARAAEYSHLIAREGSKTIREAAREPARAAGVLRMAADAARRIAGRTLPFDARPGSEGRRGYYVRRPAGVVSAIMPFNDPMAVAAHKVGPALAAGNSVVLKPDSATPLTVLHMAEALTEAGLPPGRLNVLTGHGADIGDAMVADHRVRVVAFTGGLRTGERITRTAGVKKLLLELGANSPVIVMADADLDAAERAIVEGAFSQAGQNCLSVQRVFIQRAVADGFCARLARRASALRAGHSLDPATDVCQLVRQRDADRVAAWVAEAVDGGARVLAGGRCRGAVHEATVLADVPPAARIARDEVYGPVMGVYPFDTLDEAIARANDVDFALHAAIFTESLRSAFHAVEHLRAGGVMVNDSTDYRLDGMPFGGVGLSGIGREGIDFAVEAMTETQVVCFNL